MNSKQIKTGALLSYLLIITNTLYGIFFTPFLLQSLGSGEYGVYRIIGSFIGSITILDLGIGSTVLRYISKYNAEKNKDAMANFSAMALIQAAVLSFLMAVICAFFYTKLDSIYDQSLTSEELIQAKKLYSVFVLILIFSTFEKVTFGILSGCEQFILANGAKLFCIILKVVLAYGILNSWPNSLYLLFIDLGISVVVLLIHLFYINKRLQLKIRLIYWDNSVFKQSFNYTILMFLQSIAVQFNGNLDNLVIGAYIGSTAVAVYSIGLQLYNMYEQFAIAFSDLMLPTVSRQIAAGASREALEDTVIKVGRLEFIMLSGALSGFLIIGREFIQLWLGNEYTFAWIVAALLMVPTTIPLIQNVCLAILRAENRMQFRTYAVCSMAIFNLAITVWGVPRFGPIAACIGTVLGLIFANIIAMNVYYIRVVHLNIFRIFKGVLSRIWLCCAGSAAVLIVADNFMSTGWLPWIFKVIIFCVLYAAMLLIYGLNESEKSTVTKYFRYKKEK